MNGLDAIKPWYTRRLRRLVDLAVARRISPDVFTQGGSLGLVGVVAAGAAAVCVAQGWWLGALVARDGRLRIGHERWMLSRVSPRAAAGFLCLSRRRALPRRREARRT